MPENMLALVSSAGEIALKQVPIPEAGPGQVRVRVKVAALNHRDLRLARTRTDTTEVILGSDGAGILDQIGPGVDLAGTGLSIGSEVVINPSLGWIDEPDCPPPGYEVLGDPSNGTFAEYVVVPAENIEPKPANLSWEETAAFPLAGLTAYRAVVTKGMVSRDDKVLITGIGGGVATFALQIAKQLGARVFVTSRSPEKLQAAKELGADVLLNSNDDWHRQVRATTGGVDVVIESVGTPTWNKSIDSLRPGGRLVSFAAGPADGVHGDVAQVNIRKIFGKQLTILGTRMGNRQEFRQFLNLMSKGKIRSIVDTVMPFSDILAAFQRMENGHQFGKILVKLF